MHIIRHSGSHQRRGGGLVRLLRLSTSALLAVMLATWAGGAYAATNVVGAGQATPYDTLENAIAWANGTASAQTLQLEDAYYTANGSPVFVDVDLTIEPAAGNTTAITIEKTGGTVQVFRIRSGAIMTVTGLSEAVPITIKNSATNSPLLNKGNPAVEADKHDGCYRMTNVVFERPTTGLGSDGNWFVLNHPNTLAKRDSFVDCRFVGGDPAVAGQIFSQGFAEKSYLYLEGCDFSGLTASANLGTNLYVFQNAHFEAVDTQFTPPGPHWGFQNTGSASDSTLLFTDCTFNLGNTLTSASRLFHLNYSVDSITLVRPEFTGGCGDILCVATASTADVDFSLSGEPGSMVDLTDAFGAQLIWANSGTYTFTDVMHNRSMGQAFYARTVEPMMGDISFDFERCRFLNGGGTVFVTQDAIDPAPAFSVSINALNTIWEGSPTGTLISTSGAQTGVGSQTYEHCTIFGRTANVFFDKNAADTFTMNYCITDSSTTASGAATGTFALVGTGNLVHGVNNAFWPGIPAGTVVADPYLMANGSLSDFSSALGRAIGSAITEDIDGNTRPDGDTTPDIGAAENATLWAAADSNLNGIVNADDASPYETRLHADADNDVVPNWYEIQMGSDPLDDASQPVYANAIQITVHMTDGVLDTDFSDGTGHLIGALALQDATWYLQNGPGAPLPNRHGATVTILDSGHYVGGILVGNIIDYTIQAAAGQTPTIEGSAGWNATIIMAHDYSGAYNQASFSLKGDSVDNPITLLAAQVDSSYAMSNGGHQMQGYHIENVDFYPNPATAVGAHPVTSSTQGNEYFTNCLFDMRNNSTVTDGNTIQNGPWLNTALNARFIDCDFISAGYWAYGFWNAQTRVLFEGGSVTGQYGNIGNGQITFRDFHFGAGSGVYRGDVWGTTATTNILVDNCDFTDQNDILAGVTHGSTVTFANCDIDSGTAPIARVFNGTLNMRDCNVTARNIDNLGENSGVGVNVNIDRCVFTQPAYITLAHGTAASTAGVTFTARNSLFTSTPAGTVGGVHVNVQPVMDGETVLQPAAATLEHCTLMGRTADVLLGIGHASLTMNYCVLDASQTTNLAALWAVASANGAINNLWNGSSSGFVGIGTATGNLVNTLIVADPVLQADGQPTATSPALGAGWLSTATVDLFNTARPQGDGYNDLGAIESVDLAPDTNHTGIADSLESIDFDNDGISDYWEMIYLGDLTTANATTNQSGDGFPDWWVMQYGLDPTADLPNDSDLDSDGHTNQAEYQAGTNPIDPTDPPAMDRLNYGKVPVSPVASLIAMLLLVMAGILILRRRTA